MKRPLLFDFYVRESGPLVHGNRNRRESTRALSALSSCLGDFVELLAAVMHKEQLEMPFKNQRPWHFLFYELKKAQDIPGKPALFDRLLFDWDGPYPKSQELSEFLHALHWNASVSAHNPHYDTITLLEDVATLWSQRLNELDPETTRFLHEALTRARAEFAQAGAT
jgi:hypothetical protein